MGLSATIIQFQKDVDEACQQWVDDGNAGSIEEVWHDMAVCYLEEIEDKFTRETVAEFFGILWAIR